MISEWVYQALDVEVLLAHFIVTLERILLNAALTRGRAITGR